MIFDIYFLEGQGQCTQNPHFCDHLKIYIKVQKDLFFKKILLEFLAWEGNILQIFVL
jgi:hypothetical protein